jgi:hypothetical protein
VRIGRQRLKKLQAGIFSREIYAMHLTAAQSSQHLAITSD